MIAVQVKTVLDAIKDKKEVFDFMGEVIKLKPTVGMWITMNPGWENYFYDLLASSDMYDVIATEVDSNRMFVKLDKVTDYALNFSSPKSKWLFFCFLVESSPIVPNAG